MANGLCKTSVSPLMGSLHIFHWCPAALTTSTPWSIECPSIARLGSPAVVTTPADANTDLLPRITFNGKHSNPSVHPWDTVLDNAGECRCQKFHQQGANAHPVGAHLVTTWSPPVPCRRPLIGTIVLPGALRPHVAIRWSTNQSDRLFPCTPWCLYLPLPPILNLSNPELEQSTNYFCAPLPPQSVQCNF